MPITVDVIAEKEEHVRVGGSYRVPDGLRFPLLGAGTKGDALYPFGNGCQLRSLDAESDS